MPDYVCEDLIADIFERLPVKSLIRFRCLSKLWCCRISSPEFIYRHTLRPSVQKVILGHEIYQNFKVHQMLSMLDSEDHLPLLYGYTGIRSTFKLDGYLRAGSCNGIICLLNHTYDVISLWNPSIRRIFSIPPHIPLYAPLASVFGFGFDPITNDYKIVRLSCSHTAIVDSFVYTTKTGTWCKIALPTIPFSYTLSSQHGCCVNGALHWLAFANNSAHDRCIMRFDLSTHFISTIALPWEPSRYAGCLKILKGSTLAVITKYHRVWTMMKKEDNDKTNNVASSASCWRMAADFNSICEYEGSLHIIFELTNGDLLFKTIDGKNFKVYNIASRRVVYTLPPEPTYGAKTVSIDTYVDSLALLDIGFPCQAADNYL